jgi:hypothetical protein
MSDNGSIDIVQQFNFEKKELGVVLALVEKGLRSGKKSDVSSMHPYSRRTLRPIDLSDREIRASPSLHI